MAMRQERDSPQIYEYNIGNGAKAITKQFPFVAYTIHLTNYRPYFPLTISMCDQ